MFSTLTQKLLLGLYIFIILSIPIGAFLASQRQNTKSQASEPVTKPITKVTPKPTLKTKSSSSSAKLTDVNSTKEEESPTIATSFGPTLSLKAIFEGRPTDDQSNSLFVGIIEGDLTSSPKFLLSFTVDLPKSGKYENLSLAGLTSGSKYTAILKGATQIATSSAFIMSPAVTNLNSGKALNMLSGDLNQDNVINSADYSIALSAIGSTPKSSKWNENVDLNLDGVINIFDITIISKNIGQQGVTGTWTSTTPKIATNSANLSNSIPQGSPQNEDSGYWIWIPK